MIRTQFVLSFFLTCLFTGQAQKEKDSPYQVGFKTIHLVDSSRIYKHNTPVSDPLHFRSIDLDIWYPTNSRNTAKMPFKELYKLHEERANFYQDDIDYTGISDELIVYLAAGFGMEPKDGKKLLKLKTHSLLNAPAAEGPFPVIFYLAGYNGMGWESFRLLEKLAENGFTVVSISSIGRYPGDMTNDLRDTMEQVNDAMYAYKTLNSASFSIFDFNWVGLLGLSWGGMSAAIILDKHPSIKAFASLDGSDVHYYGDTEQDDAFLAEIYQADLIHPEKVEASYLYLESGDKWEEFTPTDEFHYYKKLSSEKYYLRLNNSKHEDFGSLAWGLKTSEEQVFIYEDIMELTTNFFKESLQNQPIFKASYKKVSDKPSVTDIPFDYSEVLSDKISISGFIEAEENKRALPYVNIGLLNSDIGTVSDKEGSFNLDLSKEFLTDTLRISMIGYKTSYIPIGSLVNSNKKNTVYLTEEIAALNEVVLTAKKWKRKTLGNKTESKFIGHVFYYGYLGREMGIRMNVGKRPMFVDDFSFHISYNRFSAKVFFRLNIYKLEKGRPTSNILKENILISVEAKETGLITTDLRPYDIVLTEDVMVTLEWIDHEGELKETEGLVISVGLLTDGTFDRNSKTSKMKKRLKGLGLGYTMKVRY